MREGQAIVDNSVYVLETSRAAPQSEPSQASQSVQPAAPAQEEIPQETPPPLQTTTAQNAQAQNSGLVADPREVLEDEFDEDMDDEPELTFEELLEREKAFFKQQSEKPQFPRARDAKEKDLKKGRLT